MLEYFSRYSKECGVDENGDIHGQLNAFERKHWWWPFSRRMTQSTMYEHGRRHGEYKQWHTNGKLRYHVFYADDLVNGEFKVYHANGKIAKIIECRWDQRHGVSKVWDKNGQLTKYCFYKNGMLHGEYKEWSRHGRWVRHIFYQDSKNITSKIMQLVKDIGHITEEEKLIIKMKYGFGLC